MLYAAESSGLGGMMMPAVIILLMVAMYFFMIRPQNKKRRDMMEKQRQAGAGQTVVTIGGLHGTIIDADDSTITLEVSPGVMCVYERGSIARVVEDETAVEAAETDSDDETSESETTAASAVVDMKAEKSSGDDSRK